MAWNTACEEFDRSDIAITSDSTQPMIIGLSGKAGAGKNMVGMYLRMLAHLAGISCVQIGFADALKEKAERCGWNGLKDAPGRHFLQVLGTKYRDTDVDYWLRPVILLLSGHPKDLVVITDVRFPNEAQMIKHHGGEVWRVHKTMFENESQLLIGNAAAHSSEVALDGHAFHRNLYAPSGDLDCLLGVTETVFEDFLRRT